MKIFTTTLALVLTATILMAFPRGSQLTVKIFGHRANSLLVINGKQYNPMYNVVRLDGLMPGNYSVKVLRPTHWGSQGVVFQGNIRVPNRSDVTAIITRNGMKVDAKLLAYGGGSYWGSSGQGAHHTPNPNGNGGFVSLRPHHQPPVDPIVCAPIFIGMHPDQFASALRSIELATFDSDQIRVAKQVIRRNGASSRQIAEIMSVLSFESSRLEIAKFGFKFVADPENYYVVNDVFWFSSSIRELDRFINRY